MENSIEETIKQLELILKVRKEQKEIIECAGGTCMNCDPDIKALSESIEILSDYKRILKENEYMHNELDKQQTKINKYAKENEELKADNYELNNRITDLLENIPVQKVKDKIEFLKKEGYWLFTTDRDSDECVEFLQELLGSEK